MQILITRDPETRLLTGKITPENKILEGFLETEIQNDAALIKELRGRIENGKTGEIAGNAYLLQPGLAQIRILPLFEGEGAEAETEISIADFLFLLAEWEAALRPPHPQN